MKKVFRLLAVLLAVMALAGCSLVKVNTEKVVVAKVGDQTISKADFDEAFGSFLSQYGYTVDSEEIADQLTDLKSMYIDQMVEDIVLENKCAELGLDQVTDDEKTAAQQEVQDWYDEQYAALLENFSADSTVEDPEQQAKDQIESYLTYYGTTLDQMKQDKVDGLALDKLYEYVTKDVAVTEDAAKTEFDTKVADAKTKYDADLSSFVSDYEGGATIYYIPEGTFFVKHILLKLTDEQVQEISDLRADDDEAVAATADAKRDEYLLAIKEKAQTVLDLVTNGGDFDALVAEYGEDPGMTGGSYPDGYLTYKGDTTFVDEFSAACETLTADGMTTGLVASDYGYHIIRRVKTLESKNATFDEVKEALMAEMLETAKSDAYDAQVTTWVEEANADIKTDKL